MNLGVETNEQAEAVGFLGCVVLVGSLAVIPDNTISKPGRKNVSLVKQILSYFENNNNERKLSNENNLLVEQIFSYFEENDGETIELASFTPFEWDEAVIVADNYIGGEQLASRVGMRSDDDFVLPSEYTDNVGRIVFFLDGKVVRYFRFTRSTIDFFPLGLRFAPDDSLFQPACDSGKLHCFEHVPIE